MLWLILDKKAEIFTIFIPGQNVSERNGRGGGKNFGIFYSQSRSVEASAKILKEQ